MKKKNIIITSVILLFAAVLTAAAVYLAKDLREEKQVEADNARTKALQGLGYLK